MKKSMLIFGIAILLTILVTATASATKPEYYEGYAGNVRPEGNNLVYDVCDPILEGSVSQPLMPAGKATHGIFISGDSSICPGATEKQGTCEFMIISVEEPGNPDSKPGRAVIGQCTGDLAGLHGTIVINFDFTYQAWYHIDP